jgi:hypothetical protein
MAVLSDGERAEGTAEFMRECSRELELIVVNKVQLRAVYNAIDDWIEANAASFNAALPQPYRSQATPKQKARMFMHVAARKFKVAS